MAKIIKVKLTVIGLCVCLCALMMVLPAIVSITNQTRTIQFENRGLQENGKFRPSSPMKKGAKQRPTTVRPLIIIPQPLRDWDKQGIVDYHSLEETLCREKIANITNVNWCPCVSADLQGRVTINMADDETWSEIEEKIAFDVNSGGEWKPEGCVAYSRVAVVIPCRDRESHLRVLLRHLVPILKRQMIHFRIFVTDQRSPMIFNKAATMDIGFLEAAKRFPFDCVIFHDVDLLLEDDRALLRCGPHPRHYARALDKFGYSLYPTFGGVVSLTADMFRQVNGYSLKYFGWGGEDDEMWRRVGKLWDIHGIPAVVSRYSTILHEEDATNLRNPQRHILMDDGFRRDENETFADGISDVVYDINDVQLKPLFTRIEADINTTAIGVRYVQKAFRYRKVSGFCEDPDVAAIKIGISWASCRFLCDSTAGQNCFGFSYATRKCAIMRTVCNLSPMVGWTYVKEEEFAIVSIANQTGILKLENRGSEENGKLKPASPMKRGAKERPTTVRSHIIIPQPVRDEDKQEIVDYHSLEETLCREKIGNNTDVNITNVNWCPCVPANLQGRMTINTADDETWSEIVEKVGADVNSGGEWKPEGCVAYSRVAVVIPCRDRESHLRVLLRHLVPILKRQMIHFRIFVTDQRSPMIFNKAATMDIGFLEAAKRFPFDCVIFHDVDLLLEDDRALLRCGPHPRHYVRALDKFDYSLYSTFGGVVSLTSDMFRQVNGYSLKYFGWGGEDDDMWGRVGKLWNIHGMPAVVSRYSTIFHVEDATNLRNPQRHVLMDDGFRRSENKTFADGISDVVYDINDVQLKPLFTRIEADINTTAIGVRYAQKTFRYRKVSGFCEDPDVAAIKSGISWASCRFLCDSTAGQSCFGFSYVVRKCAVLRTVCNLSPMAGWTYVKEEEFRSVKPSSSNNPSDIT